MWSLSVNAALDHLYAVMVGLMIRGSKVCFLDLGYHKAVDDNARHLFAAVVDGQYSSSTRSMVDDIQASWYH
jgi:hypothetical protein